MDTVQATRSGAPISEYPRRWLALAVIAVAQLMVVLDATIVNIALPQAQADLGISDPDRQWVVTAYTLTFGGFLLLGGRIADYWGRKRTFIAGAVGFALASGLGGLAQHGATLFAARALQGAFGALLAPASLALLTVLFTEVHERSKAFAVYGAIAAGGAAVGLLLGGVLTEYANWRWCLLVNIPIALLAMLAALAVVPESRAHGNTTLDVPGAVVVTVGLASIVYGFTKAATDGWDAPVTLGFLIGGLLLVAVFVVLQMRVRNPLLPLRILLDRNRGGAYLGSLFVGAGLFGSFLFMTFYFQRTLGYSPMKAGLAALPVSAGVFVAAAVASQFVPKVGPKAFMVTGGVFATVALLWLTQIGVDTAYVSHVLPAQILLGLGLGSIFVPLSSLALIGVADHDAGAASATLNATQQVGASLGTALLNTLFVSAVTAYLTDHAAGVVLRPQLTQAEAAVHGYRVAFLWAGIILGVATVVMAVVVKAHKSDLPAQGAGGGSM
ncbi:EmrB/QacA subfamily drug resistance transporter [Hamadaea flava]|uniref:MFS transporter n=1 Tax=Hamadaea flava TaxID=1742688 RepID=A0ABV8LWZ1_9ACTN|nr:MFS transporter [Hamadaea flava]MCP2321678.1 EmrB/QacA subfamily drug resistance transporter [Hamadaea flava]